MYADDEFLALSGLQHFAFCRRQWALIHIEGMWQENLLTTEGSLMHERAHNEEVRERRGSVLTVRGLVVRSASLGIRGVCDVVEFLQDATGHPLAGEDGLWRAVPVEYKHGRSKLGDEDRLQLCAQAMCLEEMYCSDIPEAHLYYGTTRMREQVLLTGELRESVRDMTGEMHRLYGRGHVPKVRKGPKCRSCSLSELCMPAAATRSVQAYIDETLGGVQ